MTRAEAIRAELYDSMCWFGGFPEPGGDVPERYHRWDDLTEMAQRIDAVLTKAEAV